jgi:hypothetical protein
MISPHERSEILRAHGADGESAAELLKYSVNRFEFPSSRETVRYPLPDEPFAEAWQTYAAQSNSGQVSDFLKTRLVQLSFPIRTGISQSPDYVAATRRGQPLPELAGATGLELSQPGKLRLTLHQTAAGKIPLLITSDRGDFVALLRALSMRNEPCPVPESMGACIIAGYNNWDRVAQYRCAWSLANPGGNWDAEFQRLIPRKELYQDRFILLSEGFYSSVQPDRIGLPEDKWREKSLIIRREHECTHYFTRRVFSSMRNDWLDELIADYAGIVAAAGRFRADWALLFAGLEDFPGYRPGGRLENYRGDPPLSDAAFRVLQSIARSAALTLDRFWDRHQEMLRRDCTHICAITAMSAFTLDELATSDAADRLCSQVERLLNQGGYTL